MAATYEISENDKGLLITSTRSKRSFNAILSIAVAIAFYWFTRHQSGSIWLGLIALLVIVEAIVEMTRGSTVQLRVTNLEFNAKGYFGGGYRPDRMIPRADVIRMEYQEERAGGKGSKYQPAGLYVKRKWSTSCVLPGLNESQTNAVIDAIYKRFPDMPLSTDEVSFFKDEFISLGLSSSPK